MPRADGTIYIDTKIDEKGMHTGTSRLMTLGKAAALAIGAAMAFAIGFTLKKGLERALDIEDAKNTLQSLGYVATEVASVTENALAAVKGTPYALNEAMSAAVSALASGIQPGEDLERTLRLIGDAANVAKVPFTDMAGIFDKVQATGKLTGDVLNELGTRGIPILQWLADEYGLSADAMREMVGRGEVDSAMFKQAIEANIGGAALSAGDTTRGAWENTLAAIARLGEKLVSDALPQVQAALKGFSDLLDGDPAGAQVFADNLQGALESVITNLSAVLPTIVGGVASVVVAIAKSLPSLIPPLTTALMDAMLTLAEAVPEIIPPLVDAFVAGIASIAQALPLILPSLIDGFYTLITSLMDALPTLMPILVTAFVDLIEKVGPALMQGQAAIYVGIADLITALADMLPDLMPLMVKGFIALLIATADVLPVILPALTDAIVRMIVAIAEMMPELVPVIAKALQDEAPVLAEALVKCGTAMIAAAVKQAPEFKKIAVEAVKNIVASIGAQLGKIGNAGRTIIQSLLNGLKAKWVSVTTWVWGLPGKILSAIGNLGSTLVSAGRAVIQGLWDGLKAKWVSVTKWVKGLGSWIADHKGPLSADLKLLGPAGMAIMQGLISGLKSQMPGLKNQLQDVTAFLKDSLDVGSSKLFEREIGVNLALGIGKGFTGTISDVTGAMATSMRGEVGRLSSGLSAVPSGATYATTNTSSQTVNFNRPVRSYSETLRAMNDINRGLVR